MTEKYNLVHKEIYSKTGIASDFDYNIDQLQFPVFVTDNKGTIKRANKKLMAVCEDFDDHLIGREFYSILKKEDRRRIKEQLSRLPFESIEEIKSEVVHQNCDFLSFSAFVIPISDGTGIVGHHFYIYKYTTEPNNKESSMKETPFTHFFETLQLAVWSYDYINNKFRYISPSLEKIYGISTETFYEKPDTWLDYIHPEDQEAVKMIRQNLFGGKPIVYTYRLVRPNGTVSWIEEREAPQFDEHGRIITLYGVVTDITERKLTEQKALQNQQFYEAFFNHNEDAVILFDKKGQFLIYNDAATKITGYPKRELSGSFLPLVAKQDRKNVWKQFNKAILGESVSYTCDILKKDGTRSKVAITNHPVIVDHNVSGVFAIGKDITRLDESEQKYQMVVENALVGVWIIQDGKIAFLNTFMKDLLKMDEDVLNQPITDYIHPDYLMSVNKNIKALLNEKEQSVYYSYKLMTRTGQMIDVEACGTLVHFEGHRVIMETIIDITDRKAMENRIVEKEIAIELSESRHRSLLQNAYDAISIRDINGKITYTSPSFEKLFGFSFDEYQEIEQLNYISPIDLDEIQSKFKECIEDPSKKIFFETKFKQKDGNVVSVEVIMTNKLDDPSINGIIVNYRDVTERVEARERIRHLAFMDSLTNVANRRQFEINLDYEIKNAKKNKEMFVLMFLDLDRFKYVNDTLGHRFGDHLLKAVSERLITCLGPNDFLARLGGDEFVIISPRSKESYASQLAHDILSQFMKSFIIEGYDLYITASIGISLFPDAGSDADTLMKCADMAMYQAKALGKNQFYVYKPNLNDLALKAFTLMNDLKKSIIHHQLTLYYQPIVEAKTHQIIGVEALVRWRHPTWGDIPPSEFIPLAEEDGFITEIGDWVLYEACKQNQAWQKAGYSAIKISVNFSTLQLMEQDIIHKIRNILNKTGMAPHWLTIEITENTLLKNDDKVIQTIQRLRDMGIKFAVDDFGTGFSSLSYLKNYRMDILKIDKSFIDDISVSKESFDIVSTVVDLANKLNMVVVAEGIESGDQLLQIQKTTCQYVQGYFYSRPLSKEAFETMLKSSASLQYLV